MGRQQLPPAVDKFVPQPVKDAGAWAGHRLGVPTRAEQEEERKKREKEEEREREEEEEGRKRKEEEERERERKEEERGEEAQRRLEGVVAAAVMGGVEAAVSSAVEAAVRAAVAAMKEERENEVADLKKRVARLEARLPPKEKME